MNKKHIIYVYGRYSNKIKGYSIRDVERDEYYIFETYALYTTYHTQSFTPSQNDIECL